MSSGLVLLAIIVVLVGVFVALYNGLVRFRNEVKNAWSQIDVQLKRRHDLIPNLVETVKGYASHEKETFESVTKARNLAINAQGTGNIAQAEDMLSGFLGKLLAVAESYPDLKANQNFLALQEELSTTENKISFARQFYNDCVLRFNNKIEVIPSNIIASMFNFKKEDFFEIKNSAERETPQVKF